MFCDLNEHLPNEKKSKKKNLAIFQLKSISRKNFSDKKSTLMDAMNMTFYKSLATVRRRGYTEKRRFQLNNTILQLY